jgi:hypothetical protein
MTRLLFTSFSALLLSTLLAPVANAQSYTGEQESEGTPTMRVLNQYNPQDDEPNWQPNNAQTDPGQATTTTPGIADTDAAQIEQPENQPEMMQPGMQPEMQQPGMQQPGTTQPAPTQPGVTQPGTTQPGVTQPSTNQPGMIRSEAVESEIRSLPTMRVLNEYNPRDHERNWQANSPSHDIVSDRRTIEELRWGGEIPDNVTGEALSE